MSRILISLAALAVACPFAFAVAADGDVDLTFGDAGQVTIVRPPDFPTAPTPVGDVLALDDGAYLWTMANQDGSVWVGRTRHDGSADTAFGGDGSGHVTLTDCVAYTPTFLAPDGEGGTFAWIGACLAHIRADGSIDDAFGEVPLFDSSYLLVDFARDAAGRFVFAATTGRTWDVFRFASDGVTPDTAFGDGGHVRIDVPASNNLRALNALAVRDDGRILVAGWRGNASGPNLVVAELTAAGDLDPGWNGGAIVDLDPPEGQAGIQATALAIALDGTVVVGGLASSGLSDCCLLLTRFDDTGAVVAGFGLRLYDFDVNIGSFFEGRDSIALRADGSILFATTAFPFSIDHRTQFVLMRTDADGVLDATFGNGGWRGYTIADPSGTGQTGDYDELHAIAATDDSVLMFGRTFFEDNSNGLDYISMVRATFAPADTLFADGFDP